MPRYSIVVPLHNEQENVTDLYDRLKAVMEINGESFEIVLVDDGSTDRSFHLLREIAAVDSRVTVVRLRRNFGQTSALAAGFDHARGEYIIAMDGDLQHDPADIPIFLEKISEGYDIVSGWRKQRIDNLWLRRIPSRCANWLLAKKFLKHSEVMAQHGPLMLFASVLLLAGFNMLAIGLLGEMQVRHYHEPTRRAPYSVERILRAQSEAHSVSE